MISSSSSIADDARTHRLVESAYDILNEEGLEGLTVRAVLGRTALARRAFYERFKGKDDLVLAVFTHTIRRAAEHYRSETAQMTDPMDRLRVVVLSIALGSSSVAGLDSRENGRRGAAMSREHLRLAESRPAELQAALTPLLAILTEMLAAGIASGQVRGGSAERLATLIYNLVSTTIHAEFLANENERADPERRVVLATDIWEFCRRAIAA